MKICSRALVATLALALALAQVLPFVSCGAGNVTVTGVTVSPKALSVAVGAEKALTATVSPLDASDAAVTWRSSDAATATVNPATGIVAGVAEGTVTIVVITSDGGWTDACDVTVTPPPP